MKTKEYNEKCLGSQIKKIEICIGDWLELTPCVKKLSKDAMAKLI